MGRGVAAWRRRGRGAMADGLANDRRRAGVGVGRDAAARRGACHRCRRCPAHRGCASRLPARAHRVQPATARRRRARSASGCGCIRESGRSDGAGGALVCSRSAAGAERRRRGAARADGFGAEVDAAPGYLSLACMAVGARRAMRFDGDPHAAVAPRRCGVALHAARGINEATVGSMLADALIEAGGPTKLRAHPRVRRSTPRPDRLVDGAIGAAARRLCAREGRDAARSGGITSRSSSAWPNTAAPDTLVRKRCWIDWTRPSTAVAGVRPVRGGRWPSHPDESCASDWPTPSRMAAALVRSAARQRTIWHACAAVYGEAGISAIFAECACSARASMVSGRDRRGIATCPRDDRGGGHPSGRRGGGRRVCSTPATRCSGSIGCNWIAAT